MKTKADNNLILLVALIKWEKKWRNFLELRKQRIIDKK